MTTAKYPTTVVTLAQVFGEMPNFPEMVLSGAHNDVVGTITLTATVLATWPTVGGVTIDSEHITYTGKAGATLTGCTRGAESTTAASHSDGAKVGMYLSAAQWNQVVAEVISVEDALKTTGLAHNLLFTGDNARDIGAAGATRPRTIYVGTSVSIGATPAASGAVRMTNNQTHTWKNSSAVDVDVLTLTSGDVIRIGNTGATPITIATSGLTTIQGQTMTMGDASSGTTLRLSSGSGTATAVVKFGKADDTAGFAVGQAASALAHQFEVYDLTAGATRLLIDTNGIMTMGAGRVVLSGALTAGGLVTNYLQVATSGPLIYSGSGAPSISAAVKGSLYLRSDGTGTTDRIYVAKDTAGTWASLTAAS